MPNQIYSLNPSTIIVTSSFEENVKKLEPVCIPPKHIIDIYIESQKYAQNIRDMTNPMRFIEARESEDEFSDIRFRQLERAYNDVVRSWSKLKPLSFIQQYEAYVAKRPNNTGIENGIASEIFFRFTSKQNKTLIIDPTLSFIKQQQQYGNQLIYTYSDDRYCQMCQYTKEKDNIKDISCMDEQSFDRVLYFARDSTPDEIQQVLENIKSALVEKASTGMYILMPTAYLEKRHSEGELWDYLTENYTIFKIVLMPQSAVKAKRKKQCLLILQNKPAKNCREILVQKTKPVDEDKIEVLEFRRIPFTSFTDRDRTLSEMYNTDYTDYSEPNRRKKPVEYQFTKEITIWVSITQRDEKYRPYYSLYDYPNSDQMRKNTLLRGKPIKTHIPGKWYASKEEALPLPKEKQRLVPVVRPVAEMMSKMFSTQGRKSPKAPLFAKPGKETEPLTPRQLRDYYNSIADQLGIPEIKLSVDVENSSQATTDISDYQGDFLRCNFDFHARYDTKLETESINYLMGRKLETTEGQYYCDYRAKLMQLLMRAQLDQWAARYFAPPPVSGVTRILPQKETLSHAIAPSNQPVRTRIELDIDPSGGGNMDSILLRKRLSSVA